MDKEEKRIKKLKEEIDRNKVINISVALDYDLHQERVIPRSKNIFDDYVEKNNLSKEYIYKEKFKIFIFINQPNISDLLIANLKFSDKGVETEARSCDSDEWKDYFYEYICPRE